MIGYSFTRHTGRRAIAEPVVQYALVELGDSTTINPLVQTNYGPVFARQSECGTEFTEREIIETFEAPDDIFRVMELRGEEFVQDGFIDKEHLEAMDASLVDLEED